MAEKNQSISNANIPSSKNAKNPKNSKKFNPDNVYLKGKAFMLEKQKNILKKQAEMQKHSFKPKLTKNPKYLEENVRKLRETYDITMEHTHTPVKARNKIRVREDAELAQQKIQDFLDRSHYLQLQKEKRISLMQKEQSKKEMLDVSMHSSKPIKKSEKIMEISKKYKNTTLMERRNLYMEEKRKNLRELKREKRLEMKMKNEQEKKLEMEAVEVRDRQLKLARRKTSQQLHHDNDNQSRSNSRSRASSARM